MPLGKKNLNYPVIAQAFLERFYPQGLPKDLATHYITLCKDFSQTPLLRYFLHKQQSGTINLSFWKELIKSYHLDENIHALIVYLKKRKQLFGLKYVLEALVQKAEQRGDFMRCAIMTSHEPSKNQQEDLLTFFKKQSGKELIPRFIVEPSLICGIKLRSPFLVAEYSVARFLRRSKKILTTE